MLWLWYIAFWADVIGLVPRARPEARLMPPANERGRSPMCIDRLGEPAK
jgi:hypothetical protein